MMILAGMGDELWCGQVQNMVNFDFKLNLTLKVTVSHPKNNNQGLLHLCSKFSDPILKYGYLHM